MEELSRAVSVVIGEQWTPNTHMDEAVNRAFVHHCSALSSTDVDEAFVEALGNGILHGDSALPLGVAVRKVFDKWFRFDSPGVDALAATVLGRAGVDTGMDRRSKRQGLNALRSGAVPDWRPLDLANRVEEGRFFAYQLRAQALERTETEPDAHFRSLADGLPLNSQVKWADGSIEQRAPRVYFSLPALVDPPTCKVLNAPSIPSPAPPFRPLGGMTF